MSLRDELHEAHKRRRAKWYGDPDKKRAAVVYDFWLEKLTRRGKEIAVALGDKPDRPALSLADIKREVARFYIVPLHSMTAQRRQASFTLPRQVAMYLCACCTQHSLPTIGRSFSRDHTTVIHAIRKIERERQTNERLEDEIELITMRLGERFAMPGDVPEAA